MTHASLFSGIGGFDLAAVWMGWENLFNCELDSFCTTVLKYHFPESEHYDDIKKTDFTKWKGKIDILTGGFPCQPFSVAGRRKGKEDDRYLWPEMLRAIREIQPAWVVGENVAGIISMVQPGSEVDMESQTSLFETSYQETLQEQEYIIETICSDIEREGYSVQPVLIPACGVGAPHRRDRVWFIAQNTQCIRCNSEFTQKETGIRKFGKFSAGNDVRICCKKGVNSHTQCKRSGQIFKKVQSEQSDGNSSDSTCFFKYAPYSGCPRLQRSQFNRSITEKGKTSEKQPVRFLCTVWEEFPTQPPLCSRNDGFSDRLDGITFSKWRKETIRAYGNAIVPQVAFEIFQAIENTMEYNTL